MHDLHMSASYPAMRLPNRFIKVIFLSIWIDRSVEPNFIHVSLLRLNHTLINSRESQPSDMQRVWCESHAESINLSKNHYVIVPALLNCTVVSFIRESNHIPALLSCIIRSFGHTLQPLLFSHPLCAFWHNHLVTWIPDRDRVLKSYGEDPVGSHDIWRFLISSNVRSKNTWVHPVE